MDGLRTFVFILAVTNIYDAAKVSNCTKGVITLNCPTTSGCVLRIDDASFGHAQSTEGDCLVQEDDCRTNASFIWEMCHGRSECSLHVPQERPGADCAGIVSSYITIEFECVCVSCRTLPDVSAGRLRYSSPYLTPETTASYSCDKGHDLIGPGTRTCGTDGTWTGQQPACSVPIDACPFSTFPRRTYGSQCYEVVTSVAPWEAARNDCRGRNGSLWSPKEGEAELGFLSWQLDGLGVYNYVWITKEADRKDNATVPVMTGHEHCLELYKPSGTGGATWKRRNATCSYLNAYLCVFDIDPDWAATIARNRHLRNTKAGIGIGVGIGIVVVLLGLFCIICRDRQRNSESYDPPQEIKTQGDLDVSSQDADIDLSDDTYDDTLPECDVTPTPSPDVHKYAQVDKRRKNHPSHHPQEEDQEEPHANYDEVYATMNSEHERRYSSSANNTYENVTVHNLVGSLKKKLIRPWRHGGSHRISPEVTSTPEPGGGAGAGGVGVRRDSSGANKNGVVVRRHKPHPAPKPHVRKSALEAKMAAIKAGRAKPKKENGYASASPGEPPASNDAGASAPVASLRRAKGIGRKPDWEEEGEGREERKPHSGIEIVENDIYDSDEQQHGKLTEL